jgi:hypothetical protein
LGLIPRTDVAGFAIGPPWFWPMGAGAARPFRMERVDGVPWRVDFTWDDAGRLADVRVMFAADQIARREVYVWVADRLDRIRHFDASDGDVFGDDFEYERVFAWDDAGRPTAIQTVRPFLPAERSIEAWTWSEDGHRARIVESSSRGVLAETQVTYDDAMRLSHLDRTQTIDGARRVLELAWAENGCLATARERAAVERLVRYRSDAAGRLVAHSRDDDPDVDLWAYRYDGDAP